MWQLSFLNTGLLIFAAATVIPLIIWLLAKKKPPRVIFSTIRFILQTEKEQKTRSQLKNILLLIIRMLIILLVILAASRPSLLDKRPQSGLKGRKHPPTAIAIMLDTSYSMDYTPDGKSYLEYAKAAILEINKRTTEQDLVVLVTSNENWNSLNSQLYAGKLPPSLMGSVKTTWQPIPLAKMYELALKKVKESQYSNQEIYVLTDGQSQALPPKPEVPLIFIPIDGIRLSFASKTASNKGSEEGRLNNLSCQNARPVKQLTDKQQTQTISFNLVNHGTQLRKDVLVRIDFNGVKTAEKFVTLQPGEKLLESFPVQVTASGWQTGYVEVLDEKLTADNRAYYAFRFDLHPTIGVITRSSSLPLILNSVLSVFATPKGMVKLIQPEQVNTEQLKNYSFLVVYNAGELSVRLRQFLNDWNSNGKRFLFIANREPGTGWKAFYTQHFGLNLKEFVTAVKPLSFINPYHQITSLIDTRQIKRTSVTEFWAATAVGKAVNLLSTDTSPLAVATDTDILWLFDPAATNNRFFLEASYPVLAFRCFEFLSDAGFGEDSQTVGQTVSADKVILPDNHELELNGNPLRMTEPGIYSIFRRGDESQNLAVQPDYTESTFKPLDIPARNNYHILENNWQQQLFLNRAGLDLWKYCLLAVLFLMLMELLIIKTEEWKKDK